MSYYVGIDIGGTYVKYGVIDNQGKLVESGKIPTRYESEALLTDLKKNHKEIPADLLDHRRRGQRPGNYQ